MRLVQWLPERWHGLTRELAKFGTIGVVNLFVNIGVANLLWLTVLRDGEVKAKAIATVVATTSAYFMNRHWTYRDRPKSTLHREYALFFFFNLVGLVIETAVLYLAKYGLHLTHILALNAFAAIGIALGTIFRFWAYRTHVFKPHTEPVEVEVDVALVEEIALVEENVPVAATVPPAPVAQVEAPLDEVALEAELDTLVSEEQAARTRG